MSYAKVCDCCGNVFAKNTFEADFGDDNQGVVKGICIMFEETDKRNAYSYASHYSDSTSNTVVKKRRNAYLDLCDDCARKIVGMLRKEG